MSYLASLAESLRDKGEYHEASEVEIIRFKLRHAVTKRQRQRLADGARERAKCHRHRVARG